GFFGFSDTADHENLLLLPAHGVFFEFRAINNTEDIVPLEGVNTNIIYELIITTNNGLWRYALGDTVRFVSVAPYRFVIEGRTKHFINVAGEELMVFNAENAISLTCKNLGCEVNEFSAAPLELPDGSFCHEWFIEFENDNVNTQQFGKTLDENLQKINSDYRAKREGNRLLKPPKIIHVYKGFFRKWLEINEKLGAQHKVPRLANHRSYADEFHKLLKDLADNKQF
ncbi:MAG: GH3 auxin-responsive promoter family protein, partial [Chitinophagales bacterium]|nr:GH3 auxin-responsive promoter family protein [Chitinophagales bacterium]